MKKAFLIITLLFAVLIFSACSPKSYEKVSAELSEHIFADFDLINSETTTDKSVYTFRDENCIEFTYESRLSRAFTFSTIFSKEFSYCDYAKKYASRFEQAFTDILSNSGLEYTLNTDNYDIIVLNVNARSDVEKCAQTTLELINAVGEIPTDAGVTSIAVPYVKISVCNYLYVFQNFLYVGTTTPEKEDIESDILYSYVNSVRQGKSSSDDVTDSDYENYPAADVCITYEDVNTDDFIFNYNDGGYEMEIYDLMLSKSHYSNQFSFKAMCEKFGISCEETVTGLKWTIGESTYYSKYAKKYKELIIHKDDEVICTLALTYTAEESYYTTISPDELALMLDCTYKVDNRYGRIYFNAN